MDMNANGLIGLMLPIVAGVSILLSCLRRGIRGERGIREFWGEISPYVLNIADFGEYGHGPNGFTAKTNNKNPTVFSMNGFAFATEQFLLCQVAWDATLD